MSNGNELSELRAIRAIRAIRAAKNRRVWGRWATMRYLARHGVSVRLYQVAMACEAAERGEFVEIPRRTH